MENPDALAAAGSHREVGDGVGSFTANYPPGYVKTDDGRPRH